MLEYPIVKIPQRFLQINQAVIPLPSVPKKPVGPTEPKKPEEPDFLVIKKTFASSGCLSSLIMYLISGAIILIGRGNSAATLVGIIVLLIALLRPFGSDYKRAEKINDEKRKTYIAAMEKYDKEKQLYDDKAVEYINNMRMYNEEMGNYEMLLKESESDDYEWKILKHRGNLMSKALAESAKPVAYTQHQYKSGVTEEWFFAKLIEFFSGHDYSLPVIKKGARIMPQGENEVKVLRHHVIADERMARPYMPDIIISIASNKQSLVIEIDEPYVGSNGNPIHYANSKDGYRDKYFLANGWIVIRFAEEQIVKNSLACFCYIVDTALRNTPSYEMACIQQGMSHYWDEIILDKVPQWTKEQAHKMAFARYRNSYLPIYLIKKIKEEEYLPESGGKSELRTTFNKEEYDKRENERRMIDEDEGNNYLPF